jgi:pimeloyl-ACP methyl ester carboxylesterase
MLLLDPKTDLSAWSIGEEVEAITRVADAGSTWDLVGYSGGAAICLAFAAANLGRVGSLTLIEPPWIGNDPWSVEQVAFAAAFDRLIWKEDHACHVGFFDLFAPGTAPPALNDTAALERIIKAVRTVWRGYSGTPLDRDALTQFRGPVLLPFGDRSAPRMAKQAQFLSKMFSNADILEIAGAHHFNILTVGARAIAEGIEELRRR